MRNLGLVVGTLLLVFCFTALVGCQGTVSYSMRPQLKADGGYMTSSSETTRVMDQSSVQYKPAPVPEPLPVQRRQPSRIQEPTTDEPFTMGLGKSTRDWFPE